MPGGLIEALSEWRTWRREAGPERPLLTTRGGPEVPAFTFRVYQKAAKRGERLSGAWRPSTGRFIGQQRAAEQRNGFVGQALCWRGLTDPA